VHEARALQNQRLRIWCLAPISHRFRGSRLEESRTWKSVPGTNFRVARY
jgi:hypothetical protein